MVAIRHSTTAAGTNNPNKQVSVTAWNDDHTLSGTADTVLGFDNEGIATEKTVPEVAATRSDMAALSASAGKAAFLRESGREGTFVFDTSDLSAEVTADTLQGIYVPPASDTTGASGAWVRKYSGSADPRWFGAATAATAVANAAALQAAITLTKDVGIPSDLALTTQGGIAVPSGARIVGHGGTIDFDASATAHLFRLEGDVSDVVIRGLRLTSSSDVGFMHLVRLQQVAGTTVGGLDFCDNVIEYTPSTGPGAGDRWAVCGAGEGIRKNVRINGNRLTGPMQLTATLVATGTFQDSEICFNRIHNARSNAISLLGSGLVGYDCTLDNVKVTDNVITADANTSIGIGVGIDDTGANDKNTNITNLLIARNFIDISASSAKTADIFIRLGNDCSGIGGFASENDNIVIDSNTLNYGVSWQQNPISTAALSRVTNHVFSNNKVLGGVVAPSYMTATTAASAKFTANTFSVAAAIRPGAANGHLYSSANTYGALAPLTADAEFTWHSDHDTYLGSVSDTDRVVTFSANAGKVQTGYFDHCTIDSSTTASFGQRSAIYTTGAGNPTVTVRSLATSTSWNLSRYEVATGSITETNTVVGALGYTTGAGGTVTQATSKSTNVTLNKLCGQVTMNAAALAAGAKVVFAVLNNLVAAGDNVIINVASPGAKYRASVTAIVATAFEVTVENFTAGSLSEAVVLTFTVLKGATS